MWSSREVQKSLSEATLQLKYSQERGKLPLFFLGEGKNENASVF